MIALTEAGRGELGRGRVGRGTFGHGTVGHGTVGRGKVGHTKTGRGIRTLTALFLFAVILTTAGCGMPELSGGWADPTIKVDGDLKDWGDGLGYFEAERVTIGVKNDDKYLYVAVSSGSPAVLNRVLMQGLTVWADPQGGRKKVIGIRYPLGIREVNVDSGSRRRRPDPRELLKLYESADPELRVCSGESRSQRMSPIQAGVEVALGGRDDELAYELRIPLAKGEGEPYAIGARPGTEVGLGLEVLPTEKRDFRPNLGRERRGWSDESDEGEGSQGSLGGDSDSSGPGGDDPGGDDSDRGGWRGQDRGGHSHPGGGGPDGGFGGRGGFRGRQSGGMEPLKLWVRVRLVERAE